MSSKYLNLEAAAARLSLSVEELNDIREKGDIRGFADRGTWKFRADDVDELARTLESDSSFDLGIMGDEGVLGEIPPVFSDDSKINLDDELSEQPTIISKNPASPPSSDSDVRLVIDPSLESDIAPPTPLPITQESSEDSDGDVQLADEMENSDSDVQLADEMEDSDSDVQLADDSSEILIEDSDVRHVEASLKDVEPTPVRIKGAPDSQDKIPESEEDDSWGGISDSDVRLASIDSDIIVADDLDVTMSMGLEDDSDSDSDVSLLGGDPDDNLSDLRLEEMENTDSDITLMPPEDDSSVRLEEFTEDDQSVLSDVVTDPASGLSFTAGDSGISLDLSIDSGISLESDDDDSITLSSESGISLVPDSGLGLTLDTSDEDPGGATIPMLDVLNEDENDTAFDMPLLEDSGEIVADEGNTTNVVMFDDDDDGDDQTMEFDSSDMDAEMGSSDEFVDFDDDDSFDELSDSELNITDDLLDDDDILDVDDDSFSDEFESGESVPALAVPGAMRGAIGGAVAADWDMVSFGLVVVSTGFMGVCTLLMFDLVRTMWGYDAPIGVNGIILETLQGIIKS